MDAAVPAPTIAQQAADLEQRLTPYYGDQVRVEYIDVLSPRMREFPLAQRAVFATRVPLPVVALDGQPRIAGSLSIEMISSELEKRGIVGA
jgi:hypothetical protein